MTPFGDNQDMRSQDDELLAGRGAPGDGPLVDLVSSLRTMAQAPAPAPNAALAALLADGLPAKVVAAPFLVVLGRAVRKRATSAGRWVGGLGLAGKIVLGAGVAMAGVTGAATIPAVPDVVQNPAHTVLTDVGMLFGGSHSPRVAPVPTSTTPSTGRRDDRATTSAVPDGATGTSATSGDQTSEDGARTGATTPNRPGGRPSDGTVHGSGAATTGPGTTSAPGQDPSSDPTSSSDQPNGSGSPTSKSDPSPTRSPQPSGSPRVDASSTTTSSDR